MRKCAFCHSVAAMSGEHIWSDWIGRLVEPDRRGAYTFRRVDKGGNTLSTWKSDKLDWTSRIVCESCNSTWMSDLENAVKPALSEILLGRPVALGAKDLAALATSAFKTTVITDQLRSDRSPFFERSVRTRFRLSRRIPSNVQMWLAAFHGYCQVNSPRGTMPDAYASVPLRSASLSA